MNYNINISYAFQKIPPYLTSGERKETWNKLSEDSNIAGIPNPSQIKKQENMKMYSEAAMMDFNEVQNFLFMLIGAEIQVKEENSIKSGNAINMLA